MSTKTRICPQCQATVSEIISECPECGYVFKEQDQPLNKEEALLDTDIKKTDSKKSKKEKASSRKSIKTFPLFILIFGAMLLMTRFNKTPDYFTHKEKISTITLGMSQTSVNSILGEPHHINNDGNVWYYYGPIFKKQFDRYEKSLEQEGITEKTLEMYEKLAGKQHTFTMITFSSSKEVKEVLYDTKHTYDEFDRYATKNSTLKSVEILEPIVALKDDTAEKPKIVTNINNCGYKATLSKNSFLLKQFDYPSCVLSKDYTSVDLKWSDDLFEYSLCEPLVTNQFNSSGEYTVGEGATTLKSEHLLGLEDKIQTLVLPSTLSKIEKDLLSKLILLSEIQLSSKNPTFVLQDQVLYNEDRIIWVDPNIEGKVIVPDGIKSIGDQFANCQKITDIHIPSSVFSISMDAFENCSSLNCISVDKNNTEYFSHNGMLCKKNGIPFDYKIYHIPEQLEGEIVITPDFQFYYNSNSIFSNRKKISKVFGLKGVPESCFINCISLQEVIFIETDNAFIGKKAFEGCTSLTSIVLPETLEKIEDCAFKDCTSLKTLVLPRNLETINNNAFENSSLTSITIQKNVTDIEENAFANCSQLTDVYYTGTKEEWEAINIHIGNDHLTQATIHYNWTVSTP